MSRACERICKTRARTHSEWVLNVYRSTYVGRVVRACMSVLVEEDGFRWTEIKIIAAAMRMVSKREGGRRMNIIEGVRQGKEKVKRYRNLCGGGDGGGGEHVKKKKVTSEARGKC